MEAGTCNRCKRESEQLKCLECPVCTQISSILCFIFTHWLPSELRGLVEKLREQDIPTLRKESAERGAGQLVALCQILTRLAWVSNCETEFFKRRVIDELVKQSAHQDRVTVMEKENGTPGEFNRRAGAMVVEVFQQQFGKAPKPEPPPQQQPVAMTDFQD